MNITIDGQDILVKGGETVLAAALAAGVYIPHLCNHPDLEPLGGCRLCCVEDLDTGLVVPSCLTIVRQGLRVAVSSPPAEKVRKLAMELILATHPADCTGCPKYGKCELQSMYQYMGVGPERWRKKTRSTPNDDSNPLISHSFTRCVRCGRCIRACRDLRGAKVLDYQHTPEGIRAGIPAGLSLAEAGCKFCGACIEVCPTGSIMDAVGVMKENQPYGDSVVPCRAACPAGIDIPRYIRHIKEGDFDGATAVVREKVPFPETLGRICNHACEASCKRNVLDSPVSICKLKRVAAEEAGIPDLPAKKPTLAKPTGKKVAVVGAGPGGLTSAFYLAKKGHGVTVFEQAEKAGGQCRYGIPAYRLPDDVLDREIQYILDSGVELKLATPIISPPDLINEGFDAVLITTGTHSGRMIPLAGKELDGVLPGTDLLRRTRTGELTTIGERVVVLGGGNVAFDCARTAVRLGAKEVHIACLESLDAMMADPQEIEEGLEEGIILHNSSSFKAITGQKKVESILLNQVESFHFDQNGELVLNLNDNGETIIPADNIIFAVGQGPEGTASMGVSLVKNVYIQVDDNQQTDVTGVFASGDVTTGTKTVIAAIADGRKCAETIDLFLGGNGDISDNKPVSKGNSFIGREEGFAAKARRKSPLASPLARKSDFSPVEGAFPKNVAIEEAERCLQCDLRLDLAKTKLWNDYR